MIGWRDLTRLGRIVVGFVVIGAVIAAVALVLQGWNSLTARLPWSDGSRLERAETRLERVQTDLAARETEVAALERQADQTAAAHETIHQARAVTTRATTLAETAADATDPIDPARADRLRAADRRLCGLSPNLCQLDPDHPAAAGT